MKKLVLLSVVFVGLWGCPLSNVNAQGVGVNTSGNPPDPSAIFDASSTTKGTLITRMTTTQRGAIVSPAEGLMIFNTTTKCFEFYASGSWLTLSCGCNPPASVTAATNIVAATQIAWNWNIVSGATGYKYNTVNNYSTATDNSSNTSYIQTGLTCNTSYTLYVWAYGICGSSSVTTLIQSTSNCPFICGNTLTDSRDGQNYSTVLIGSQCWMAQNLNYGTYAAIQPGAQTAGVKYCQDITGVNNSSCPMGGLYEWANMMNGSASCNGTGASQVQCSPVVQGLCPTGWHIPSHYEWTRLERVERAADGLDSSNTSNIFPYDVSTTGTWLGTNEGSMLKETGTSHWASGNTGTNSSGFTALPGGASYGSLFYHAGSAGRWWSSTQGGSSDAWYRELNYSRTTVYRVSDNKSLGHSIRCVKD